MSSSQTQTQLMVQKQVRVDPSEVHTMVGHKNPDLEHCVGSNQLRLNPLFSKVFNVNPNAALKFVPAGPLRDKDWVAEGLMPSIIGSEGIEAHGFKFFDCGGGQLDQHGQVETLKGEISSLDLMVHFSGVADSKEYTSTLKFLFDLVSKNDLYGEDIVQDHKVKEGRWPRSQRTLRNFITALNLVHGSRPDVVVRIADYAIKAEITFAEEAARRITRNPDGVLADLNPKLAIKTARKAFLMENIIKVLSEGSDEVASDIVAREYERAFDRYEAEWEKGVRDYWNTEKTKVVSGIKYRREDENGKVTYEQIVVARTISDSARIGEVCRHGNWSKEDNGVSRPDQGHDSRRPADVVVHFQQHNQRKFVISSGTLSNGKGLPLHDVAAAVRLADLIARGARGLKPDQIRSLVTPGHGVVTCNGKKFPLLFLAEFGTAFGHLRSGDMEPTPLSKEMIREVSRRALGEGLSKDLVHDILQGRVLANIR